MEGRSDISLVGRVRKARSEQPVWFCRYQQIHRDLFYGTRVNTDFSCVEDIHGQIALG